MAILVFFAVVFLFSLTLGAIDKIRAYKQDEKSVWEDAESVYVKSRNTNMRGMDIFMKRIA